MARHASTAASAASAASRRALFGYSSPTATGADTARIVFRRRGARQRVEWDDFRSTPGLGSSTRDPLSPPPLFHAFPFSLSLPLRVSRRPPARARLLRQQRHQPRRRRRARRRPRRQKRDGARRRRRRDRTDDASNLGRGERARGDVPEPRGGMVGDVSRPRRAVSRERKRAGERIPRPRRISRRRRRARFEHGGSRAGRRGVAFGGASSLRLRPRGHFRAARARLRRLQRRSRLSKTMLRVSRAPSSRVQRLRQRRLEFERRRR